MTDVADEQPETDSGIGAMSTAEGEELPDTGSQWVRNALRRNRFLVGTFLAIVGVFTFGVHPTDRLWKLAGKRPDALRRAIQGINISGRRGSSLTFWSIVFATAAAVWTGIVIWKRLRGWQRDAALVSVAIAFAAAILEDVLLRGVVHRATISNERTLELARASNARLLFAALSGLWIVSSLGRSLQRPPGIKRTWGTPSSGSSPAVWETQGAAASAAPITDGRPHWRARDDRFAITVSGGGIRSASFALGALQVLREEELLQKARWMTSVSGGSYLTGALATLNQPDIPGGPDPLSATDGLAAGSAEEQWLRRNLQYLVADKSVAASAIARIVMGLFFNLVLLYLVTFAFVRPIGWLIGTPFGQRGLRIERAIGDSVEGASDDPDVTTQPYLDKANCPAPRSKGDPRKTELLTKPGDYEILTLSSDPYVPAYAFGVRVPSQCVTVSVPGLKHRIHAQVTFSTLRSGEVAIREGKATIERQPLVTAAFDAMHATIRGDGLASHETLTAEARGQLSKLKVEDLFALRQPVLKIADGATGLAEDAFDVGGRSDRRGWYRFVRTTANPGSGAPTLASVVHVATATALDPLPAIDQRQPLDSDKRHWAPAAIGLLIGAAGLLLRITVRPRNYQGLNRFTLIAAAFGAAWGIVFVVLPRLVSGLPPSLMRLGSVGPAAASLPKTLGGVPVPTSASPIVAWLILSVSSVLKFVGGPKKGSSGPAKGATNARAFTRKIVAFLQRVVVGLAIVVLAVVNAVNILAVGAMNGPRGRFTWLSTMWFGHKAEGWFPPDVVLWALIVVILLLLRYGPESMAWSPGPVYKRRLGQAFGLKRESNSQAKARHYGPDDTWSDLAKRSTNRDVTCNLGLSERAGFVDGKFGDGTELVLCATANILGPEHAPTGRRATSFSASRSFIGGPEVGWMDTQAYVDRLGKRRSWDINVSGMTAISGAAVSPAMGKSTLGPLGSLYAMLNIRLGAWLPNPRWVEAQPVGKVWKHNPGWTWFAREVLRLYSHHLAYYYVTDGGHWENLGLVEALRRGAKTVIVVSAAGDGALSHATFAEAVEIARTDLGIDIVLDDIWKARPTVGGDPIVLAGGREYVLGGNGDAHRGRVAPQGFAFGQIKYRDKSQADGMLLLIEATMIDGLPVDVHAYAESHPEFPNVSTADQLFTDRDFESYRILGRAIAERALADPHGVVLANRIAGCNRVEP